MSRGEAWLWRELAVHTSAPIDRVESGGDDLRAASGLVRCGCADMTVDSAVWRESGKIRITLYPVGRLPRP